MYREHFGLREPPFRITPQTEYFFAGAQRGALLDALAFAVQHDEGIIMVTGEVGVGKTMLCRMLLDRLPPEVRTIYLANPSLNPRELLDTLAHELAVSGTDAPSLLRAIEEKLIALYADGRRVLAIIDEAHAMPRESLELVRLLSNLESPRCKLLQIALFGQPELEQLLQERAMRSLRERITQHFRLQRLNLKDVAHYLSFRLHAAGYRGPDLFAGEALRILHKAADGLTRRVNILADKTLLAAFATNTRNVTASHVRSAIRDAGYRPAMPYRSLLLVATGLGLLTLAAGAYWYFGERASTVANPTPPAQATQAAAPEPEPEPASSVPTQASAAVTTPPGPTTTTVPEADIARLGALAASRLQTSRDLALKAPPQHWFIQLQTVSPPDPLALQAYLERAQQSLDPAQLHVYETQLERGSRIGVYYGEYVDAKEAAIALARMPEWVRSAGAYPRRYSALQP